MKRVILFLLPTACCLLPTASAGQPPSLFRGVVVANSPSGVRVVSVEDTSQASLADLRPEDILLKVNDTLVRTIDEFAIASQALKGKAAKVILITLRNGQPHDIVLHLYSFPVLRHWELAFIPEHDVRFADPKTGSTYWARLARGFETADDLEHALNAYLNALHHDPTQVDLALKVSALLCRIAQARLKAQRLHEALLAIQEETVLLSRIFDQPLTDEQLQSVRTQLQQTLQGIRNRRAGT